MGITVLRFDLRTVHAEGAVGVFDDVRLDQRFGEAGPTGAAIKLVERGEQRFAGDDIDVDAGLVVVPVGVVKGRLRAGLTGNAVLLGGELLLEVVLGRFTCRSGVSGLHGAGSG